MKFLAQARQPGRAFIVGEKFLGLRFEDDDDAGNSVALRSTLEAFDNFGMPQMYAVVIPNRCDTIMVFRSNVMYAAY